MVFATGDRTEMGRIAGMMNLAEDLQTPLTRKIAQFSRLLLYVFLVRFIAFCKPRRSSMARSRTTTG